MDAAIFFSRGISKSGWILQLTLSEMFQLRLERESRDKVIIKLTKSKLPKTFQTFLRNEQVQKFGTDIRTSVIFLKRTVVCE